jgi:uncharacterized protein YdbL (DUF1318 family)
MRKNIFLFPFIFVFIACSLLVTVPAYSASIKDRMVSRIPAINALKDQGVLGENNKGLLEYRSSNKAQPGLVAGENKDRTAVYAAIGKKQNVSATLVAQRRAKMIANNGKSGHWFQKADGAWYKK